jgi:Domain of unknown function (DUF1707)
VPEEIVPAGGEAGPAGLRASDADRDRSLDRLQDALAVGMIDLEEFNDRSEQALQARTRRELAVVTADLPAAETPAARARRPTAWKPSTAASRTTAGTPRRPGSRTS